MHDLNKDRKRPVHAYNFSERHLRQAHSLSRKGTGCFFFFAATTILAFARQWQVGVEKSRMVIEHRSKDDVALPCWPSTFCFS
jgi:hypothetical protein